MLFTLIGDLVESREVEPRAALQERLERTLGELNEVLRPTVALEATIGDEFQACFARSSEAVRASLLVRLALLQGAGIDSRYGLGSGEVEVFADRRPLSQDGPGWWTARAAMELTRKLAGSPQTAFVRTQMASSSEDKVSGGEVAAVNAYLLCRDEMVDRMKQPNRNRLYGLLRGWSQSRIAEEEGATQGAISQSLARSGAFAILAAEEAMEGGLP